MVTPSHTALHAASQSAINSPLPGSSETGTVKPGLLSRIHTLSSCLQQDAPHGIPKPQAIPSLIETTSARQTGPVTPPTAVQEPAVALPSPLESELCCVTLFPIQIEGLLSASPAGIDNAESLQGMSHNSVAYLHGLASQANQLNYGNACNTAAEELGLELRNGKITRFDAMWNQARQAIVNIRGTFEAQVAPEFSKERTVYPKDTDVITFTPWSPNYLPTAHDVMERHWSQLLEMRQHLPETRKLGHQGLIELTLDKLPGSSYSLNHAVYGLLPGDAAENKVLLTQMLIRFRPELLDDPQETDGTTLRDRIEVNTLSTGRAAQLIGTHQQKQVQKITHTHSQHFQVCRQQLAGLFDAVMASQNQEHTIDHLMRLYWWSAHTMLDERGSAAKTELIFRALCKTKNIHLPPWKAGVSADLLCMQMDESEWVENFRSYLAVRDSPLPDGP